MPGFDAIIGQARPLRIIRAFVANGAEPHALLFTGIDGIGKATTALALAMALNCQSDGREACGQCRNCRRIAAGLHPDVIRLSPGGAFLRIGQIRELLATLAMKPYEARRRVVVIGDAHKMTPAAGNALLKVLEEPPQRTVLVLTALQASDLLPTIVSRCQHLRFQPLGGALIAALLVDRHGVAAQDAAVLSALSGGSISRALALGQHPSAGHWRRRRDWLAEQFVDLDRLGPADLLARAEELARDGPRVGDSLELAKSWLRDLIVVRWRPSLVIHQDQVERLRVLAAGTDPVRLTDKIARIQEAQRALRANAAVRLTLEAMMFALAGGAKTSDAFLARQSD